mgnify:CR=1 FL=1
MQLSTKKIVVVAYLQISFIDIYVKTYKQCSNALFVKAYKQCSNVGIYVKALQTLQTLHIFESQARVRIYV